MTKDQGTPDVPDVIAGAFQCSRAYAYTLMERAIAERWSTAQRTLPDTDALMKLADEYVTSFYQYVTYGGADKRNRSESDCEALRSALAALAQQGDDVRDAARYRWLRQQAWFSSPLAVVVDPKERVKLGSDCPSLDRLDTAIDAAMATKEAR